MGTTEAERSSRGSCRKTVDGGLPWWLSGGASNLPVQETWGSIPDPGGSRRPWSTEACEPQLPSLCS